MASSKDVDIDLNKRSFLKKCACACAGTALLPTISGRAAPQELANNSNSRRANFFICDTNQVTDVAVQEMTAAGADGGGDRDRANLPGDSSPITIDEYTTAQRNLRWMAKHVKTVRGGRPVVWIGFKDGTAWQRDQVKDISQEWKNHSINLDFEFIEDIKICQIRISFSGNTNKSSTGIEALSKPAGSATMFLPDVRPDRDESVRRRVVLHEFGHGIMTFGHEHRHADANYKFISDAAIRDSINAILGTNSWTIGMVRTNITDPPYAPSRTCTAFDTQSIMQYPIQPEWIVAGTAVPDAATTISQRDIACARIVYA